MPGDVHYHMHTSNQQPGKPPKTNTKRLSDKKDDKVKEDIKALGSSGKDLLKVLWKSLKFLLKSTFLIFRILGKLFLRFSKWQQGKNKGKIKNKDIFGDKKKDDILKW